jgi:adenylylsulfate kinase
VRRGKAEAPVIEQTRRERCENVRPALAAGREITSVVIWVTGLSGSGKTTLCRAIWDALKPRLPQLVMLDGDAVRAMCGNDLGYTEQDRIAQITRVQRLARMLADQELVVLVSALYANPVLLAWNRRHLPEYFEVYLRASRDLLSRRDPKGLYAQNRAGVVHDVVGVDIPWTPPIASDLLIDADNAPAPAVLAQRVLAAIPRCAHMTEAE